MLRQHGPTDESNRQIIQVISHTVGGLERAHPFTLCKLAAWIESQRSWDPSLRNRNFSRHGKRNVVINKPLAPVSDYITMEPTSVWMNMGRNVTHNGQGRYRKLTLDDFPMDHGVKDALQSSLTSRQERSKLHDRLKSARKESETLREYSRRRFQTVVDWETSSRPAPAQKQPKVHPVPKIQTSSRPKTTAGNTIARPFSLTHPPSHDPPLTPSTPTNGPTKDGSILYNGKPLLLSSIRTRPNSEPPSRFDHLRGAHGKNYPFIQKTLEQSNCEYRVGVSPLHTAREDPTRPYSDRPGGHSPDFVMLIPVTSEPCDVTADSDVTADHDDVRQGGGLRLKKKGQQAWTEEGPLLASTARSLRSEDARGDTSEGHGHDDVTRDGVHSGRQTPVTDRASPTIASPSQTTSPGREESPTAAAAAATSQLPPVQPPADTTSKPLQQPAPQPVKMTLHLSKAPAPTTTTTTMPNNVKPASAASSRQSSAAARSDAGSEASSSLVSITPRPHCWVDDVTVSSDESLHERDLSLQGGGADAAGLEDRQSVYSQDVAGRGSGMPLNAGHAHASPRMGSPSGTRKAGPPVGGGKRASSPGLLKRLPSGGKVTKPGGCLRSLKQSTASGGSKGAKSDRGPEVVMEGKGDEEVVVLPRFLCPSSESKSRQAAIKEWLAKTSFGTACRTVPLM